ncbi:MAG: 3-deoxy-D-manno-octulosonate 8-phosphate phosphatase, partial [Flavobacteriales bacterium]|nr:3-deoxy-D-manno-octulosonate 8-phosphate phosphatase [Flavobacteriales bacterium]
MHIKFLVLDVDGVMTDGGMYYTESGDQFKKFNTKDGMAIKIAQKNGLKIGFLSSGSTEHIIQNRAKTLGVEYVYVGPKPKIDVLKDWCTELGITTENVA